MPKYNTLRGKKHAHIRYHKCQLFLPFETAKLYDSHFKQTFTENNWLGYAITRYENMCTSLFCYKR